MLQLQQQSVVVLLLLQQLPAGKDALDFGLKSPGLTSAFMEAAFIEAAVPRSEMVICGISLSLPNASSSGEFLYKLSTEEYIQDTFVRAKRTSELDSCSMGLHMVLS
jgi:hypothetical protein